MPLSPDLTDGHQVPTPIYDALYATYRQSSKTLPGDRANEEDFTFVFGRRQPDGSGETGTSGEGPGSRKRSARKHRRGTSSALPPAQHGNRKKRGNRKKGR